MKTIRTYVVFPGNGFKREWVDILVEHQRKRYRKGEQGKAFGTEREWQDHNGIRSDKRRVGDSICGTVQN